MTPRTDPRHKGLHQGGFTEEIGAFLAVPITSREGVVGVLRALRKQSTSPWFPNAFTEEDEQALSTIASQVGAAIDNRRPVRPPDAVGAHGGLGRDVGDESPHMIGNASSRSRAT